MTEIERITDQMRHSLEGKAWHGAALQELLAGVSADQATARPIPGAHSIWELVLHMTAWHGVALRQAQGTSGDLPPAEDWPAVIETGDAAWNDVLARFENRRRLLEQMVSGMPDSQLNETVVGTSHDHYVLFHGVIQHDLYHGGQIALLKRALEPS